MNGDSKNNRLTNALDDSLSAQSDYSKSVEKHELAGFASGELLDSLHSFFFVQDAVNEPSKAPTPNENGITRQ